MAWNGREPTADWTPKRQADLLLRQRPGARWIGTADAARLTGESEDTWLRRARELESSGSPGVKRVGRGKRGKFLLDVEEIRRGGGMGYQEHPATNEELQEFRGAVAELEWRLEQQRKQYESVIWTLVQRIERIELQHGLLRK